MNQYTISQTKSGKWVARRSLTERSDNGRLKVQALFADSESELIEKIKTIGNATHKTFQAPKTKSDWEKLISSGTTEARIAKNFKDVVCTLRDCISGEQARNTELMKELGIKSKLNLDLFDEIIELKAAIAADRKLLRAMHIRKRIWERYNYSATYEEVGQWQEEVSSLKIVAHLASGSIIREVIVQKKSIFFVCDMIDGKEEIKTAYNRAMLYGTKGKQESAQLV